MSSGIDYMALHPSSSTRMDNNMNSTNRSSIFQENTGPVPGLDRDLVS